MHKQAIFGLGALGLIALGLLILPSLKEAPPPLFAVRQPVTEAQLTERLRAEGYANISIERDGNYLKATVRKNGEERLIAIDARDGADVTLWVEDND